MKEFYLYAVLVQDTRTLSGEDIGNIIYAISDNETNAEKKGLNSSYFKSSLKYIKVMKVEKLIKVADELDIGADYVREAMLNHKNTVKTVVKVDRLIKTDVGQYNDVRLEGIEKDLEETMTKFLERWLDIDTTDIQAICFSSIPHLVTKYHMLPNMKRLMKSKGYKSSSEAKDVKYNNEIKK